MDHYLTYDSDDHQQQACLRDIRGSSGWGGVGWGFFHPTGSACMRACGGAIIRGEELVNEHLVD